MTKCPSILNTYRRLTCNTETNHQDLSPSRPLLHIPPLLLPHTHIPRLGLRLRRWFHADSTHHSRLHIRALSAPLARHSHTFLLPRWAAPGTRKQPPARAAAWSVQPRRGKRQGRARIRVLLGRGNSRLCTGMGIPIRTAISVHALGWHGTLVRQNPSQSTCSIMCIMLTCNVGYPCSFPTLYISSH